MREVFPSQFCKTLRIAAAPGNQWRIGVGGAAQGQRLEENWGQTVYSLRRFLSKLICQSVHHHSEQEGTQLDPRGSVTSTLNPSVTPTAHFTTVLQLSCVLLTTLKYFSATPDVLTQYYSLSLGTLSLFRTAGAQWRSLKPSPVF